MKEYKYFFYSYSIICDILPDIQRKKYGGEKVLSFIFLFTDHFLNDIVEWLNRDGWYFVENHTEESKRDDSELISFME